jgi:hypothetical protein
MLNFNFNFNSSQPSCQEMNRIGACDNMCLSCPFFPADALAEWEEDLERVLWGR